MSFRTLEFFKGVTMMISLDGYDYIDLQTVGALQGILAQ